MEKTTANKMNMNKTSTFMMIGELSECSGVPVSTIKYYFRENLLSRGIKENRTTVYYAQKHVDQLRVIKKLKDEGLSLGRIKSFIKNQSLTEDRGNYTPSARRETIIETASNLFMENGLDKTSITDIVKAASISRNTFYREFKSKRDVFIACLEKIRGDMVDAFNFGVQQKIIDSGDNVQEIWNILGHYSFYTDFINFLGSTIVHDPKLLDKILLDHTEKRLPLIRKVFERHIQKGNLRTVDTEILGLIVVGTIDYCNRFLRNNKFQNADKVWERVADILINGICATAHKNQGGPQADP